MPRSLFSKRQHRPSTFDSAQKILNPLKVIGPPTIPVPFNLTFESFALSSTWRTGWSNANATELTGEQTG
jgi:hypothetical protein